MVAILLPVLLAFLPQASASPSGQPKPAAPAAPVQISVTAVTRDGHPIATLRPSDIELREDGVLQTVLAVQPRPSGPRRIAILLDEFHVSAGATEQVRAAIHAFVDEQLHPGDQAVVLKPLDSLLAIHLTEDRDRLHEAIDTFEGRRGNYTARSPLEADTIGSAPALAEYSRAQVVLSALRALATRLGGLPGRTAILLVSEGFVRDPRGPSARILPDAGNVERFANRFDVPIYALSPDPGAPADAAPLAVLQALTGQTGGEFSASVDLGPALARASDELDHGFIVSYAPAHGPDGRFHDVRVALKKKDAVLRARAGYISPLPLDMRGALRAPSGPVFSSRLLRRSPFINVWSGVTNIAGTDGRIVVTWSPGRMGTGSTRSSAARVSVTATKPDGTVLYQGVLAPLRSTVETANRAEFSAPVGRVQIDMTIFSIKGEKLDTDARDVDVPAIGAGTLLLPPLILPARSALEFREILGNEHAPPDPSREFSRTERLLIRVPAFARTGETSVTGRLLNRVGQVVRELEKAPGKPGGLTQFDLPLAPFAPGDYVLEFSATSAEGTSQNRVDLRIVG